MGKAQVEYYHRNKEKLAQYKKDHYAKNKEAYAERAKIFNKSDARKQWRLNNKMKIAEYQKTMWQTKKLTKPHLKGCYGITIEDYQTMIVAQEFRCKGCGKHETDLSRPLCIDHCHTTGKVRGLLCASCNSSIGFVNDDINILLNLIKYLQDAK